MTASTVPRDQLQPARFAPGSLVYARGREWIVLPGSTHEVLRLRPLSGSEDDLALVHTRLEPDLRSAQFPLPEPHPLAGQDAALLLRDALLMSLRRGAGPFRSFGNLAVEPRAYQLVPLLMALRLEPVRLLIADDVGIGKTIEAALIARELYDRGEIARFTVLCPPHLVDQWVRELGERFHLKATAVTATSAARLERGLPVNESIFTAHPFTVVSLDYIKSPRHRDDFIRACPELVIVDEAHTCTNTGRNRQLRFELLEKLSGATDRHMVLLTATPHSGDEEAFYHLLGLLDPSFARLPELVGAERERARERLSRHFVQRRRPDIDEWMDQSVFPQRETAEVTYRLTGEWERFFDDVLAYCADVTRAAGEDTRRQRLTFWGTLALMRCVSSSPHAAMQALRTRIAVDAPGDVPIAEGVFDGDAEDLPDDDVEPGADSGDPHLRLLMAQAERLCGSTGDPKLARVLDHVGRLLEDGFSPVIFCRYVATAHYVADQLRESFPRATIDAVTGEYTPEERIRRVEALGASEHAHILVATDCLSEGVNLQEGFDAVVHYDLSWNPTRHEQREGRVDRYGQKRPLVRATLIYGENNPVDGAVLQVILRKAESIRKELGVPVPIPDDDHKLTEALMRAVLLRNRQAAVQGDLFDIARTDEAREIDVTWTNLAENAKRNPTVFAQRRIKPGEVLPEWRRMQDALGTQQDVHRFVSRAMSRLDAALAPQGKAWRAPLDSLPPALRERLAVEGLDGTLRVDFEQPAAKGATFVHRSHPLVAALADDLLERALDANGDGGQGLARLGRTGVWRTPAVERQTTVLLLRLRHQITAITTSPGSRTSHTSVLLVEEAIAVAVAGRGTLDVVTDDNIAALLSAPVGDDITESARLRQVDQMLEVLPSLRTELETIAERKAESLLADHRRVRQAAEARGRYEVKSLTPVDVIAAYVLLPAV